MSPRVRSAPTLHSQEKGPATELPCSLYRLSSTSCPCPCLLLLARLFCRLTPLCPWSRFTSLQGFSVVLWSPSSTSFLWMSSCWTTGLSSWFLLSLSSLLFFSTGLCFFFLLVGVCLIFGLSSCLGVGAAAVAGSSAFTGGFAFGSTTKGFPLSSVLGGPGPPWMARWNESATSKALAL